MGRQGVRPRKPAVGFRRKLGQARLDSPEVAEAAAIEEKLLAAQKGGGFMVLTTPVNLLLPAERELERRFDVRLRSVEAELISDMERIGKENGIAWETIIETDSGPRQSEDFNHLVRLAKLAFKNMREHWLNEAIDGETLLISRTGLLARLDLMPEIESLAEHIRRGSRRPAALWVLIAAGDQHSLPVLEGEPIPVLGPGGVVATRRGVGAKLTPSGCGGSVYRQTEQKGHQ